MSDPVVALFDDPDAAAGAVRRLRALGVSGLRVAGPAAYPVVHDARRPGAWRFVGWMALGGALAGLAASIALQVLTSVSVNLMTSGKPIVAWVPFGIVMFELTMLGAGGTCFLSVVLLAVFSRRGLPARALTAAAEGKLAVVVPLSGRSASQLRDIRAALAGASEVSP